MTTSPGFLLDEHLRGPLWDAIADHNAKPGAETLRAYRVGDSPAPPLGTDDPELLEWAEQESCILVSCDRQTMAGHFRDHLGAGRHAPGLILLPNVFSVADVLEYLILAAYATAPEEWQDRMVYF
jgi:hypothetical protein